MKKILVMVMFLAVMAVVFAYGNAEMEQFKKGNGYHYSDNYEKAIQCYSNAIDINPSYVDAYIMRASSYVLLGNYDKAITDSTKAIEINPSYASAYSTRGLVYHALKNYDKAIADYKKAIEKGDKDSEYMLKIATESLKNKK